VDYHSLRRLLKPIPSWSGTGGEVRQILNERRISKFQKSGNSGIKFTEAIRVAEVPFANFGVTKADIDGKKPITGQNYEGSESGATLAYRVTKHELLLSQMHMPNLVIL